MVGWEKGRCIGIKVDNRSRKRMKTKGIKIGIRWFFTCVVGILVDAPFWHVFRSHIVQFHPSPTDGNGQLSREGNEND